MTFASREWVLAAAIALPLALALGSAGLADDAPPPDVPAQVRVGESAELARPAPSTAPTTTPPATDRPEPSRARPTAEVVPLPPPVDDDDDDDWGDDDDGAEDADDDDDDDD